MSFKPTVPTTVMLLAAAAFAGGALAAPAPVASRTPQLVAAAAAPQAKHAARAVDCKKHPKDPSCKR